MVRLTEPCWTYKFGRYRCRFIGRSLCGGSILNRYQILSAAHCFEHGRGNPSDWIILVGKNNIRRKEIHQSKITRHKAKKLKNVYVAKKIIVHERWRVIFPTGSYFLSFRKANFTTYFEIRDNFIQLLYFWMISNLTKNLHSSCVPNPFGKQMYTFPKVYTKLIFGMCFRDQLD